MAENGLSAIKVVVIGGSAGSLEVILQILPNLDKNLTLAIIIIMHRKSSLDSTLIDLLSSRTLLTVKEVEEKEEIVPGNIYLAPADYHLLIERDHTFSLDFSEKIFYSRPAIDATFQTAADVYKKSLAGILLSGANTDGAEGMVAIQSNGGLTIIQNPDDAEISYMPQQALLKVKPDYILDKYKMAEFINTLNTKLSAKER